MEKTSFESRFFYLENSFFKNSFEKQIWKHFFKKKFKKKTFFIIFFFFFKKTDLKTDFFYEEQLKKN